MRGEHGSEDAARVVEWGSSPHARGTLGHGRFESAETGIIPACAGNTNTLLSDFNNAGDHPRMRGEHTKKIA